MAEIRNCRIAGYGTYLPENVVKFGEQTRYRVGDTVSQLDMLTAAAKQALAMSGVNAEDLECIIGASAAGIQPIPCTAALVLEQIAPHGIAAAFDVNSTCTSMITAIDIASRYISDGTYKTVLITAGDVGSRFLNLEQKESYSLFSDAGVALLLTTTDVPTQGVIASTQRTWAAYAHDTEIRGGLSRSPAQHYGSENSAEYLFDMNGRAALRSMLRVLPDFIDTFFAKSGLGLDDISLVIPHQASPALALAMRQIGIPKESYVDWVADIGNMVSASVGYVLTQVMEQDKVREGDTVLLVGTAAGLTANALALRL
jgi:3-oxoacyl-[acyl-carrier-protein] synthase-3